MLNKHNVILNWLICIDFILFIFYFFYLFIRFEAETFLVGSWLSKPKEIKNDKLKWFRLLINNILA